MKVHTIPPERGKKYAEKEIDKKRKQNKEANLYFAKNALNSILIITMP